MIVKYIMVWLGAIIVRKNGSKRISTIGPF
jgi:hypothetical protein